ncbi:MAG: hypothetical protein HS114_24885 [Anaerolineales bacterium]|nr:hypothetical protein [Anaerolineales bacterium]
MRNLLYTMDGATLLERTQELFSYMSTFTNVKFMTISQYVAYLDMIPDEQKAVGNHETVFLLKVSLLGFSLL